MNRTIRQRALDLAARLAALYAGATLLPFGMDKLQGTGGSIQGFRQIGAGFGVDPTFFRFFVGAQEVSVALLLFAAIFVDFGGRLPRLEAVARRLTQLGALGLVATMVGALATEAIVRPGQQDWLVRIALRLLAVGVFATLWSIRRYGLPRAVARVLPAKLTPVTGL
ncbi:MAG: hypothetical protein AAGH15_12580 [Myxococcota bacterium]